MKTSVSTTADRLRACLPYGSAEFNPEVPLRSLGLDSIDTVDFLCAVHEEFGVRLTDSDFHPEQTINGLIAALEREISTLQ